MPLSRTVGTFHFWLASCFIFPSLVFLPRLFMVIRIVSSRHSRLVSVSLAATIDFEVDTLSTPSRFFLTNSLFDFLALRFSLFRQCWPNFRATKRGDWYQRHPPFVTRSSGLPSFQAARLKMSLSLCEKSTSRKRMETKYRRRSPDGLNSPFRQGKWVCLLAFENPWRSDRNTSLHVSAVSVVSVLMMRFSSSPAVFSYLFRSSSISHCPDF